MIIIPFDEFDAGSLAQRRVPPLGGKTKRRAEFGAAFQRHVCAGRVGRRAQHRVGRTQFQIGCAKNGRQKCQSGVAVFDQISERLIADLPVIEM